MNVLTSPLSYLKLLHYSAVSAAPGGVVQRAWPARQHQHRAAAAPQPGGGHPGSHQPGAEHRQPGEKSVRIATAPDGN